MAVDWYVGIELITPLAGSTNPMSLDVAKALEQMGECVYSVNFEVMDNDMQSAIRSGKRQGYHVFYTPENPSEQQLRQLFGGVFTCFEGVAMRRSSSDRFKLTYDVVEYR